MHSEMTTLSNGLRIISSYRPELETVSVGAWVKTGAAQEKKKYKRNLSFCGTHGL